MIILAVDFETTGLSPEKDRIVEVGAILFSTTQDRALESAGYLVQSDVPLTAELTKINGITQAAVDKFGYSSHDGLLSLLEMAQFAEAYIGQNVVRFDKLFIESWGAREKIQIPDKLWIDTRTDIPGVVGKHLSYMAADAGFLNLFPHSALTDCLTVLKLIENYDIKKIVERAESPMVILQSHQARTDNNLAKAHKFWWNPGYEIWWKAVKQMDVDEEVKAVGNEFTVTYAPPEVELEKLWFENQK
jgi:DNA polymerase-3 subunit epsilon